MVGQLVKKDFISLFSTSKATFAMVILFSLCLPIGSVAFACVMPTLVAYIIVYNTLAYEERNKSDLFNVSLPVSRREICLAKYMQAVIAIIGSCILSTLGVWINQVFEIEQGAQLAGELGQMVTMMLVIAFIYIAIVLPCLFYFGTLKARYILFFTYIILFVVTSNVDAMRVRITMEFIECIFNGNSGLFGIVLAGMIMIVSYTISLAIWKKKEF